MQSSQLTALVNAKLILEECGCFRGPSGPTGPAGATGPAGYSLLCYSDGFNTSPLVANTDPSVYGLFIGVDGSIWRSTPATIIDTSFTATVNAPVLCIAKQVSGEVLAGGTFSNHIARFMSNGQIDTSFTIGSGFNANVRTIAVQSNGKILVGGDFTSYNGTTVNYIAQLNTDGTLDTSFNIGTGFDNPTYTIVLQSNGKILVGGSFTHYNGILSPHLVRLTSGGFYDATFDVIWGFDATVYTIALDSVENIYVGGAFTQYNTNLFVEHIIRLTSDGSEDTTFTTGAGFNNNVSFIKHLDSSNIVVVGAFTQYQSITVNRIIQLSATGSIVNTYNTGLNGPGTVVAQELSGNLLVGGAFTTYNSISASNILRVASTDSYPILQGFNNTVNTIYIENYTQFLVGGAFTQYNSSTANYITRLKETSYSWYNTGTNLTTSNTLALNSTIIGLGTFGYISSATGTISQTNLTSSLVGLGTLGYISSSQLLSTVQSIGTGAQPSINSTIIGLGTFGYISSSQLYSTTAGIRLGEQSVFNSTIIGLGTFGYISSSQLYSTTAGIRLGEQSVFNSTIIGLGTFGYISSSQLYSTIAGIPIVEQPSINSTIIGLGTFGYISSSQLYSTIAGIPIVEQPSINSTIIGLGTFGYISSSQLLSTVQSSGTSINSTIIGLGTFGYISSSQLLSTVASSKIMIIQTFLF